MSDSIVEKINIAQDFTRYPGARYVSDGDNSGEKFYIIMLKAKFEGVFNSDNKKLEINFDGTYGYASSFISEVFRRLVFDYKDKQKILSKLILTTNDDPLLKEAILSVINETNETKSSD